MKNYSYNRLFKFNVYESTCPKGQTKVVQGNCRIVLIEGYKLGFTLYVRHCIRAGMPVCDCGYCASDISTKDSQKRQDCCWSHYPICVPWSFYICICVSPATEHSPFKPLFSTIRMELTLSWQCCRSSTTCLTFQNGRYRRLPTSHPLTRFRTHIG